MQPRVVAAGAVLTAALTAWLTGGTTPAYPARAEPPETCKDEPGIVEDPVANGQRSARATPGGYDLLASQARPWHVEHDDRSCSILQVTGREVAITFHLSAGVPRNQFAAAVTTPPVLTGYRRLLVRAAADRPARIAVQMRQRDDLGAARWRRTMYVDSESREATFDLDDFTPVPPETAARPPRDTIAALMLGVDTVNTRPGTRATLVFTEILLER